MVLTATMLLGCFMLAGADGAARASGSDYLQDLSPEQQELLDDLLNMSTESNPYTDDPDSVELPATGELIVDEQDLFASAVSPQSPDETYYRSVVVDVYDTVTEDVYYDSDGNVLPFSQAVEFETIKTPGSSYSVQLMVPLEPQMEEGDVVLAMFYLRTVSSTDETGTAMTQFVFERESPNLQHMKFLANGGVTDENGDAEWIKYYLPFKIQGSDIDGNINSHSFLNFRLGYKPQTIQIAGLEVYNYKQTATVDTLPRTVASYEGMNDPNAQWRLDALERIEQLRKGDFSLELKDKEGNPIADAVLNIDMKQHDFKFGTAVSASTVTSQPSPGTNAYNYIDALTNSKLFNSVVFETELKWPKYEQSPSLAEKGSEWAKNHDLYVRGHALVWDNYGRVPTDVSDLMKTEPMTTEVLQQIEARVDAHIVEEMEHLKEFVPEWDVVNEPILNGAMRRLLAPLYENPDPAPTGYTHNPEYESLVRWFTIARETDPNAVLYINDGITSGTVSTLAKFLDYMNAANAPYDGIGIQSHFASGGADPAAYSDILYNLGNTYDKRIAVTEYDLNSGDDVFAAKFMRDILILLFSNEYVDEFIMWGFWDGSHWLNNAPLFYKDWSLKPSGQVYKDLVTNLWWTTKSGVTDDEGVYSFRGYKGTYEGTVLHEGKVGTFEIVLDDDSAAARQVVVNFDPVVEEPEEPPVEEPPMYATFTDPLDDFSLVHEKSVNWEIATSSPEHKGDDPRRAMRSTQTEEHLVYHIEDMQSLAVKAYHNVTGDNIQFYTSSTGESYEALTVTKTLGASSGAWQSVDYTAEELPEGTNYLKIVVPANEHQNYTPQLGQIDIEHASTAMEYLVDDFDDFSKVTAKSDNWVIKDNIPGKLEGDTGRVSRATNTEEYLIYHVDNMQSFALKSYFYETGNNIKLYGSATDGNYQELNVTKSEPAYLGSWYRVDYTMDQLPEGTNYLKVVVPANEYDWTPQIGQIRIGYEAAPPLPVLATLSGDASAQANQEVSMVVGLANVEEVSAEDITVTYNPQYFSYLDAEALLANSSIQDVVHDEGAGTIRFLMAHTGSEHALTGSADTLKVNFRSRTTAGSSDIQVSEAILSSGPEGILVEADATNAVVSVEVIHNNKDTLLAAIQHAQVGYDQAQVGIEIGNYPAKAKDALGIAISEAEAVAADPTVSDPQISQAVKGLITAVQRFNRYELTSTTGDLNDVEGFDVGDIGIITWHYGLTDEDEQWNEKFDLDGDGEIGLYELTLISMRILQ